MRRFDFVVVDMDTRRSTWRSFVEILRTIQGTPRPAWSPGCRGTTCDGEARARRRRAVTDVPLLQTAEEPSGGLVHPLSTRRGAGGCCRPPREPPRHVANYHRQRGELCVIARSKR